MRSVRARLTAFTIIIVELILVAMGALLRHRVHAGLIGEIDRQLASETALVTSGNAPETGAERTLPGLPRRVRAADRTVETQDPKLVELVQSNASSVRLEAQWPMPRLVGVTDGKLEAGPRPVADVKGAEAALRGSQFSEDFTRDAQPMRSLSAPVRDGGRLIAVVQAVRPLQPILNQMRDLDRALLMSVPLAILLAAFGGSFLVAGTMRPLRRLTEAARRLEANPGAQRLPTEGGDEFSELASAFNEAFDRTADAFASQARAMAQLERFTGDAGHELRTPLASIKASASYLLHMTSLPSETRFSVEVIDRSSERMAALIDDLLLLARRDAGQGVLRVAEISVSELISDVIESLGGPSHVQVSSSVDERLVVVADRFSIERSVTNLLSNALRYASKAVTISAELEGDLLTITVVDDGPGIGAEHLGRLGERFFRPDESRSRDEGGVGLGLAIVKRLCESHGGSLEVKSELGKGTTAISSFRVALNSLSLPGERESEPKRAG